MISININKAKDIAHDKRRAVRAAEFAPLDLQASVSFLAVEAEAKRQAIRDKYAALQEQIIASADIASLSAIMQVLESK